MQAILFYLLLPLIYLIAILPFRLLYIISDFLYLVIYRIFGYRKKVVLQNLTNSFPEKSEEEIKELAKKFYKHLFDLFLETFKTLTISEKEMQKRCAFTQQAYDVFADVAAQNRSIVLVLGHMGNWEWAGNTFSMSCKHQLYVIYKRIENKRFDELVYKIRTRFGTKLIETRNTFREMVKNRKELNATAFIADQTATPENAHWMTFLNQDTPVFKGTEVIAKKLDYVVVYGTVKKVRRGYYEIYAEKMFDYPKETAEGEISEAHTKKLEQDIIAQPEIWLWSHRRWKHKRTKQD